MRWWSEVGVPMSVSYVCLYYACVCCVSMCVCVCLCVCKREREKVFGPMGGGGRDRLACKALKDVSDMLCSDIMRLFVACLPLTAF